MLIPEDSGQQVMCGACGALLQAPVFSSDEPPSAEPLASQTPAGGLPPLKLPGLGLPPAPPTPPPAPQPPSPPAPGVSQPVQEGHAPRKPWLWIIVAASILAGMLLGGVLTVLLVSSPRNTPPAQALQDSPEPPVARETVPPPISSETPSPVREPAIKSPEATATTQPAPALQLAAQRPTTLPATTQSVVMVPSTSQPAGERVRRPSSITDQQIEQAIRGGVEYLLQHFGDAANPGQGIDQYSVGVRCLCIQALLQCGQTLPDERLNINGPLMRGLLDALRQFHMGGLEETYARSIRATTLAIHNRPEDRAVLRADVAWLLKKAEAGAYTYGDSKGNPDNSNSQYGLLGVWAGAEAGLEVPHSYWQQVRKHWTDCQYDSGVWGYLPGSLTDASLSMTVAGTTSLLVAHEYLDSRVAGGDIGREPYPPSIARALAWLEQGDNCMEFQRTFPGYTLYGIERAALASGFKYFGVHEWYPELAQLVIDRQIPFSYTRDGKEIPCVRWAVNSYGLNSPYSKNSDLIETAFSLLFLARGRHPILMNKLRFEGYWSNRPRDVANLTRFASKELERPLNWQVVPLDREWSDWMDWPILYIASHKLLQLTDEQGTKLRKFAEAGGLIFTHADGDSEIFSLSVTELGKKLFPGSEWKDLPLDHPIYTLHYKVQDAPPLRYLGNGSRILMLHSPKDLAQGWQVRAERTRRNTHELGVNLFIYAAGKTDLRHRLSSPYLPEPSEPSTQHIPLARVRYSGPWNPEPYAFIRFGRWLRYETGCQLDTTAVSVEFLTPTTWPVAHMTGVARYTLSQSEIAALRHYVEDGGVLLIDACGGSNDFDQSTQSLLRQTFPQGQFMEVSPDHPLLAGKIPGTNALPKPLFRPGSQRPQLPIQILPHGKGAVIYSALDLTTGLLGTNTWGLAGYQPAYAQSFLRNVVLWTADRRNSATAPSAK
ncbi:MAG TPA: DUF4159 domain-containing protein [Tepidisphaeraceae bacterium]|nr:DUF4159 domain-containing protein [Tepidisphaeraceae bacterium]